MNQPVTLLACLTAMLGATPARAQPSPLTDRTYVTVSGWYQAGSASFTDVVRPVTFAEPARVDTTYSVKAAAGFDASGGVRLWRNLAVGVEVSHFSKSGRGSVAAQMPHPFFFNRPRSVSGDASDLARAETAVHAQLAWMVSLKPRWQLAITGGPSWFTIDQDLVTEVTLTQSYPYDTAEFAGVMSARRSASHIGFNAGGDLDYMPRRHVGVGIGVAFSHATVPLNDTMSVDAGGVHVGGGIRFRF
jgi:hypothetical protein